MPDSSLRIVDAAGREIIGAVDDQPLRARLRLDVDPESAPDTIQVTVVGPDGTKRKIDAERIDWGAERPLYQTELTTVDEVFSQFLEALDPITGHAPEIVDNGQFVHFEYEGMTHDVQTFDSAIDARHWYTRAELADRIGANTTRGINLTNALRNARELPESPERDRIIRELERRIRSVRHYQEVLEEAKKALDNPHYYMEQQIQAAQFYMGIGSMRDAMGVHDVLERAKETAEGHIISGMAIITLGGYQMLVESTGAAQVWTMLSGTDVMGKSVTWDQRVTAFCDLVADGMLQGASLKFELDHLVATTRPKSIEPRRRYDGPKPEELAPEHSIVDPSQLGMPPGATRAAFRAARQYDCIPLVRPTNPEALAHLGDGALPKPESLKSKTVNELDTLLGMQPQDRGLVAMFEPETTFFEDAMRSSSMSKTDIESQIAALENGTQIAPPPGYAGTELWNKATARFIERSEEITGATGKATQKLVDAGEIRIERGLIVDAETGKFFTGDHDLFDFVDLNGVPVPRNVYDQIVTDLMKSEFRAQHGAHARWDPKREDFPPGEYGNEKFAVARKIYEKIIAKHQGSEILIAFPPVGPPIALFAGSAPGQYLGDATWAPTGPGSFGSLPTELRFFGPTGTVTHVLRPDSDLEEWSEAAEEFRSETTPSDASVEAFDTEADAAAARAAQFDAQLAADDEEPDLSEFDDEPKVEKPAGRTPRNPAAIGAAAAAALIVLGGTLWFGFGRGGGDAETSTGVTVASPSIATPTAATVDEGAVDTSTSSSSTTTPATTTVPASGGIAATVQGTLDPVITPDPAVVTTVAGSNATMEFSTSGGPFSGSARLELVHDVPEHGCQFQSAHAWEFSGEFDPATLEFRGSFNEVEDITTGNCDPDDIQFVYQHEPAHGDFYAGLYWDRGEIWGVGGFGEFTAPVEQSVIDAVLNG